MRSLYSSLTLAAFVSGLAFSNFAQAINAEVTEVPDGSSTATPVGGNGPTPVDTNGGPTRIDVNLGGNSNKGSHTNFAPAWLHAKAGAMGYAGKKFGWDYGAAKIYSRIKGSAAHQAGAAAGSTTPGASNAASNNSTELMKSIKLPQEISDSIASSQADLTVKQSALLSALNGDGASTLKDISNKIASEQNLVTALNQIPDSAGKTAQLAAAQTRLTVLQGQLATQLSAASANAGLSLDVQTALSDFKSSFETAQAAKESAAKYISGVSGFRKFIATYGVESLNVFVGGVLVTAATLEEIDAYSPK